MADVHDRLLRKLEEHSELSGSDIAAVRGLPYTELGTHPNDDIVRQGDKPRVSVVVIRGMVARYHTLRSGRRQYLSLHNAGDMPDAQSLFIETMDHAVCAIDEALVALVPHSALIAVFQQRTSVALAIWRETLIDAAIFREAITNNSGRALPARLAHFFCEQYYRARAAGQAQPGSCRLPLTQTQLGETVGASLPSVSRALQTLRETKSMDLRGGQLRILNWDKLAHLGEFDPAYLHLRKRPRI
jgi:CRP-like cAMP-binding protein